MFHDMSFARIGILTASAASAVLGMYWWLGAGGWGAAIFSVFCILIFAVYLGVALYCENDPEDSFLEELMPLVVVLLIVFDSLAVVSTKALEFIKQPRGWVSLFFFLVAVVAGGWWYLSGDWIAATACVTTLILGILVIVLRLGPNLDGAPF